MSSIRIKRRSSTGSTGAPATLLNAELAYNEADNTLYYGYGDNGSGSATSVTAIAGSGAYATLGTTQTVSGDKTFSGNLSYSGSLDSGANNTQVATTGWVRNRITEAAYTLPAASENSLGGIIVGSGLVVNGNGTTSVSTSYIKDDAANGTLTITGDSGTTTADLVSETTGSHYQMTVNNSGTYGFMNWYLKSSSGSQAITWGGFGVDSNQQQATFSYNYAPNFGSGLSYGRGIKASGNDVTLTESVLGGATLPTKVWTSNSILSRDYADSRYLLATSSGTVSDLTVTGNLTVQGTTTTLNTATLVVEDKNILLANVSSPSDITADGGGFTLLGATNKSLSWYDATDAWTSSEHFDLVSGKEYRINNSTVLTATSLGPSVVSSSLTSVGTVTSGAWNGSIIGVAFGGTGADSITGLVKGNGSNAMTAAVAGTDYLAPDSTIDGGTF